MADPQMLPAPIELVKLQLHRQLRATARATLNEAASSLAGPAGEGCLEPPWNQRDKPGTGLAWPAVEVLP